MIIPLHLVDLNKTSAGKLLKVKLIKIRLVTVILKKCIKRPESLYSIHKFKRNKTQISRSAA